jgi:hypothetical protein
MQNNNGPIYFLSTLGFICLAVWWISSNFGANTTGFVLLGLGIAGAIVLGFLLNMTSNKNIMANLVEFNKQDAQTDRYRQQSYMVSAKGDAAERVANAKINVIDAKRVDQLATQKAKILMDAQPSAALEDKFWNEPPDQQAW